jgi:hypothetical protein
MKCICGYEDDKASRKFIMIGTLQSMPKPETGITYSREIFACPKCGTLKIEDEE